MEIIQLSFIERLLVTLFLVMKKFKMNLWNFLSQKTTLNFNLTKRLNLAINLASEVRKFSGNVKTWTAHRDLKPNNVMLDAAGQVRIIDAGTEKTHRRTRSFQSWGSCGTVAFVAPEQFTCDIQSRAVDIWALGKIIALIIFEWKFGWRLLWSPKFLKPDEINSLGPLVELIDLLKDMLNVSYYMLLSIEYVDNFI